MFYFRQNTESESEVKTFAVLVAAWAGAFPIPLDWDRPWQVKLIQICGIVSVFSIYDFKSTG